jgi:hypothetical protein
MPLTLPFEREKRHAHRDGKVRCDLNVDDESDGVDVKGVSSQKVDEFAEEPPPNESALVIDQPITRAKTVELERGEVLEVQP